MTNQLHNCSAFRIFIFLLLILVIPLNALAAKKPSKQTHIAKPEPQFIFEIPSQWLLTRAGDCDTLTLFLRNPADPLQQLFFFPRFGPVYMSQDQKLSDLQYETLSGHSLTRRDMPIVNPLTPENFVRFLPQILQMKTMRDFLPDRPGLRVVEPISATPQKNALEYPDTQTAIIRFLFVQDNQLGEGLLAITTVPSPEYRSAPGGGIGMGYLFYGITAAKGRLDQQLPELLQLGRNFKLSASYEKECRKGRAEDLSMLIQPGNSLQPVLDSMASVWKKRTPAEDMAVERRADTLRQVERLHRTATGEVYEFPLGFSKQYLTNSDQYNLSDLQPLPDDPRHWQKAPPGWNEAYI